MIGSWIRRCTPLAGAILLCLTARAPGTPSAPPAVDLQTAHYDLHVEGLDAKEIGDMLEQLHAQLQTYFGTAPSGRLSVALYATREKWTSALRADRQFVPPGNGGYYAPFTGKVYAWIQPSAYFTRHVLLHEATHQFHWLAATGNRSPSAEWYFEGLAEYFGMHNWDGQRLQTGVIPAITLEDYPSAAWKNYQAAGGDLTTMCSRADRPEAWALVRFLLEKHPARFRMLAAALDRQEEAVGAWNRVFGSGTGDLSREFGQWLKDHRQPWQVVWVAWQQRGDAIESDAQTMSMTVLKETPKALTVRIEPQTAGGTAGLVFAYRSADDFYLFQVLPGRQIRILRRLNGAWMALPLAKLPPMQDSSVLAVTQDQTSTVLWAAGKKIATIPAVGQVGLNAENGRIRFRLN